MIGELWLLTALSSSAWLTMWASLVLGGEPGGVFPAGILRDFEMKNVLQVHEM